MNRFNAVVAALTAISASPAAAAVLQVNGSNQLTGATGVTVGGATYDVSFVEGTCAGLFSACDNAAQDFTFTTQAAAQAAALALLTQVLIDSGLGQFDTDYALTLGCATNINSTCAVLIPFATNGVSASVAQALNTPAQDTNLIDAAPALNFDTGTAPQYVFARFSLAPQAVPEPATWAMMLFGFGGMGLAMRRRKTARASA